MTAKPLLAFQPAPRPQPRTSPEQTRELTAATSDLGFGRPTSSPSAEAVETQPELGATEPRPRLAPTTKVKTNLGPKARSSPMATPQTDGARKDPSLKFDVPDGLWSALRHEALNRRVTVKYLVLEALADKGYEVDLSAVPEDGRRLR